MELTYLSTRIFRNISNIYYLLYPVSTSSKKVSCCCCCLALKSCLTLCHTPWTVAHKSPLSMGFSRQEYWSGLPWPPPGDLPNPGIESMSPELQVDSLPLEPPGKPKQRLEEHKEFIFISSLMASEGKVLQVTLCCLEMPSVRQGHTLILKSLSLEEGKGEQQSLFFFFKL